MTASGYHLDMPVQDSPFPGMDPYLERHWSAVHAHLVPAAMLALNALLPEDLIARCEERLSVGAQDFGVELEQRVVPDVRVFEPGMPDAPGGATTLTAPFQLVVDLDPVTERFIRIIRPADEQLVTVVEFVSPANKSPAGIEQAMEKRSALLSAGVHVVEIDLVRRGNWRKLLAPHLCPPEAVTAYRYTVRLGGHREAAYLYPVALREPLRPAEVPLRPTDPKVTLDLRQLIADVYRGGRYGRTLNYREDPDPPLAPDDAVWADALLRSAGLRG